MRLLLVEDARSGPSLLEELLRREPDFELLPPVHSGADALAAVRRWNPQLVLMDVGLGGGREGVETIGSLMAVSPRPIVALDREPSAPGALAFEALSAGAVEVLEVPRGETGEAARAFRERLVRTVRTMTHARVVGRKRMPARASGAPPAEPRSHALLVLGGSTGAPPLIYALLRALPAPAPFPVLVAQHIVQGFEAGFAQWLSGTGHPASVARGGDWLESGKVYVAPADRDLVVRGGRLKTQPARGLAVPSVNALFESVADFYGERAVGVLLTGMGSDGAQGLLAMRRVGALTVTQVGATCVVDGMPAAARTLGAASRVLTPTEMLEFMGSLARAASAGGPPRGGPG